ncbi:glycine receptor subunit alpha-2-like [Glandiceps talaboti]
MVSSIGRIQSLTAIFTFLCMNHGTYSSTPAELERVISEQNYDEQLRPDFGGPPVNVSVGLFITSIHSLSEISMDYGATLYLVMEWNDPRLKFNSSEPIDLRSGSKVQHMIWTPDVYFVNVKDAELHQVTETNKQIRVHPRGHVTYDIRVSLVLICHMHLHRFPMDKQSCAIEMESFSYSIRDVHLHWGEEFSAIISEKVALPGFIVRHPTVRRDVVEYPMGHYDHLVCDFSLDRELIFYVMEHYVPSSLLVILSWVSFWLSVEATPARASLGITTVLTLTTLSSSARNQLPKVSYTKAIDIWMLVCSFFVFAALLEFAISSYDFISRKKQLERKKLCQKSQESVELEYTPVKADEETCRTCAKYQKKLVNSDEVAASHIDNHVIKVKNIDKYARFLFPAAFVLFNIVYWPAYLV